MFRNTQDNRCQVLAIMDAPAMIEKYIISHGPICHLQRSWPTGRAWTDNSGIVRPVPLSLAGYAQKSFAGSGADCDTIDQMVIQAPNFACRLTLGHYLGK